MSTEPKYERFAFSENDNCNKLLPTNTIKSKFDFFKITTFDFSVSNELLDLSDAQISAKDSLKWVLGLPLPLLAKSDLLHDQIRLASTRTSAANRTTIAADGFGVFFPVNDIDRARDEIIRKVLFVDSLKGIKRGELEYRGRGLDLPKNAVDELLNRGFCYASVSGTRNDIVKIVLRPRRKVEVADVEDLTRNKKLRVGKKEKTVCISDRQLTGIAEGGGGIAVVGKRPVWLYRRRRASAPSSVDFRQAAYIAPTHGLVNLFDSLNDAQFCKALMTVLSDDRAPADLRASVSGGLTIPEMQPWLANLSNETYQHVLGYFRQHPRSQKCSLNQILAGAPSVPQYRIGVISRYEQQWELLGYSKGTLISSINLAPGEEMQLEVFTWDKQKVEQEKTFSSEYEFNREINSSTKADTAINRDMTEALSAQADANLNVNIPSDSVTAGGGLDGGGSWSNETQFATDVGLISEAAAKSAEKFKSTHRVKIVETHEFGEENRTLRKIRNPNLSRALTFNYFEILENYRVTTRLIDAFQFCLLVENPAFAPFDIDFVLAYEYRLQQVLLSPNYAAGFEAARLLAAQRWFDESSGVEESLNRPTVPAASPPEQGQPPPPGQDTPVKGIFATAQHITEILENDFINLDIQDSLEVLSRYHNPFDNTQFTQQRVQDATAAISKYCFWFKLINIYPGFEESARQYVEKTSGKFGRKSEEAGIVNALKVLVDRFDDDWLYSVKMFAASTVVQAIMKLPLLVTGPFAPVVIGILEPVILPLAYNHDDRGLSKAISVAKKDVLAIADIQNSVIGHEQVDFPAVAADQTPSIPVQVPQLYSHRELAEAHADFTKLIVHLEKHRTYYSNEIWRVEDQNERYARFEQLGIAAFVGNTLLGFVGNKAVYPLRVDALPKALSLDPFRQDLDKLNDDEKQKEELVAVPTAGVHMDTLLGQCDALESHLVKLRKTDLRMAKAQIALIKAEAAAVGRQAESDADDAASDDQATSDG